MMLFVIKRLPLLLLLGVTALIMANCTMLGLNYASLETRNKPDPAPMLNPSEFNRSVVRASLERDLYGPWPENLSIRAGEWRTVDGNYLDGRATLQEVPITIGSDEGAVTFTLAIALPSRAPGPVPLVLSQTFSDNCSVFPDMPVTAPTGELCDGSSMTGLFGFAATQIFGTYIAEAPVGRYIDAGLGYASFYGSDYIPDSLSLAPDVMANLGEAPVPTGTLMAWAYGFKAAADILKTDPRVRTDAVAAMGHSRFGKSALLAAAYSASIDSAIAHQSGFAGSALSQSPSGERLDRMAASYPHWLRPGVADDVNAGNYPEFDQHFLLALIAPKPVFLGNGRRDVWSDPNSSYRAAKAADAAYVELGRPASLTMGMQSFVSSDPIAFWLRPGGHSIVTEDIDAFIDFMSAQYLSEAASLSGCFAKGTRGGC